MKRTTLILAAALFALSAFAQEKKDGYSFTTVKENPITSVKNQSSSGTCWSFSGIGFLESELIRMGKGTYDLSEMFIIRKNFEDKAKKYIRTNGHLNFAAGGSFADVFEAMNDYGLIPDADYRGLNYGTDIHKHGEMDNALSAYVKSIRENKNGTLSTAWYRGFQGIVDAYLGQVPETFTYNGKSYTPASFRDMLGLKASDYVSLTSFNHYPFYKTFIIEVPDNWRWAESYNLPLDELIQVIDNALEKGYTVAWASDVSEMGFTRDGIGIVPDENAPENAGSDQARWLGLSVNERNSQLQTKIYKGENIAEKNVTQEMRQTAYDNYQTTDDHGMLIYGIANDQYGKKYYMVKNSWGETGKYKGLWYVSEAFVRYKTLNLAVNKQALPKNISSKLGVK
ncbi:MAG: aminopeptidase [Dysgonamonadaceae bacterium]|jgi:aminopeptidase C|nr:aminopeptidase [Dysgonamonadaceae bacterium]